MMPEVSGFDVVEQLRAEPRTAAIPVIVVTAKDITQEDRAALNGHVARVVSKTGFDAAAFAAEVRRVMKR